VKNVPPTRSTLRASAIKHLNTENDLNRSISSLYKFFSLLVSMSEWVTAAMDSLNYLGTVRFKPDTDIPDLTGKVILITGGKLNPNLTAH
jgi:hypothetical protein